MRISAVSSVSRVMSARKSNVVLRMDAIRASLRESGAAIVNPDNKIDAEAIKRLQKIHGSDNVSIERSPNAKLTIKNFKR